MNYLFNVIRYKTVYEHTIKAHLKMDTHLINKSGGIYLCLNFIHMRVLLYKTSCIYIWYKYSRLSINKDMHNVSWFEKYGFWILKDILEYLKSEIIIILISKWFFSSWNSIIIL